MGARLRSWWQQIKQHRLTILVVISILVVVIAVIAAGYSMDWAGFNGYDKITIAHTISGTNAGTVIRTEEYQPGKTLWDWLQLLIIPLVLAVVALLFNLATTRTEQKIAAQRYENDQYIALDKQREDLLQTYLDRMSELLLEKQLRTSAPDAEVRNVARVRTITILFQLDARRIGYVFAFLREAGLISSKPKSSIVSLSHADLDSINLSEVDLSRTDLSGTTFRRANLSGTNLSGTNFYVANLREVDFREADLSGAFLVGADLFGADLEKAILKEAVIIRATLRKAILKEADLSGALLARADFFGAEVTEEQLKKAKSLEGATMPDGSKHP